MSDGPARSTVDQGLDRQTRRLEARAVVDGTAPSLADLGAASITQRETGFNDTWLVCRHASRHGEIVREYLSERNTVGERCWTEFQRRGAFAGFRSAQSAIAQTGSGVAIRERCMQMAETRLEPSTSELAL